MKHIKLYENFDQINEKVQSDIVRSIIKSDITKRLNKNLDHVIYGMINWAKLKDSDFEKITPKEARGKKYETTILFWFKNDKLIASSNGKDVYQSTMAERGGRYGRGRAIEPSSKALADESDNVYALINTGTEDRRTTRNERSTSKQDALALANPQQIADKNRERYRSLIAQKKTADDSVDVLVKHFMDKYSKELTDTSTEDVSVMRGKVSSINLRLHNLLENYDKYLYIVKDAKKGSMYSHQEGELKRLRDSFKKWEDADEVDPFKGSMVSSSTMDYLHKKRR